MADVPPYLIVVLVVGIWFVPVIIMFLRGRGTYGSISIFLPVLNLLILRKAVLEPATPDSRWAERFYGENMMQVSRERYPGTALVHGTYSEKKQARAEYRAASSARKLRRKGRRKSREAKAKARRREFLRPSAKIAEAKARDRQQEGDPERD